MTDMAVQIHTKGGDHVLVLRYIIYQVCLLPFTCFNIMLLFNTIPQILCKVSAVPAWHKACVHTNLLILYGRIYNVELISGHYCVKNSCICKSLTISPVNL